MTVGFLGLGVMGTPMALNLCKKFPVVVWSRSRSKFRTLELAGAELGETPAKTVEKSDVIFTMLFDGPALLSILDDDFKKALYGKTLVNTASVSIDVSHQLSQAVSTAGGHFIEMPVSGSKVPAEQGQLIGMMAGEQEVADRIRPWLEPITRAAIYCGPIGSGLKTKYAINIYLITMTTGLAESMNLARAQGLDLHAFEKVLDAGPMASTYSKLKVAKMLKQDWSAQAAIKDVHNNTRLIQSAAEAVGIESPLLRLCKTLFEKAELSGLGQEDMVAIGKVLANRST